jgi:hypothetical protein
MRGSLTVVRFSGTQALPFIPRKSWKDALSASFVEFLASTEASSMLPIAFEREIEKRGREMMLMFSQNHIEDSGPNKCQSAAADRGRRWG